MKIRGMPFCPPTALLFTLLLVLRSPSYSQSDPKTLERQVSSHISEYYSDPVTIHADDKGTITVDGEADNLFDKLKITDIISEVSGVHSIVNNMSVHNDLTIDAEIQTKIELALERNDAISEPEKIKVEVKKGVVYLTGTVNYFREKLLAQSAAASQDGVSDMVSTLTVVSPAVARSDDNLKAIVSDIMARFFPLEKEVSFAIQDGSVELSGTATTLWAKRHIEEEIQRVLGVRNVTNLMEVK